MMILPDLNLLVHAYNDTSPVHDDAKAWWEALMGNTRPVCLAWVVVLGRRRNRRLAQPTNSDHCRFSR